MSHARSTDPDTSHAAIPRNLSRQARRVLRVYRNGSELLDHDAYLLAGFEPCNRNGQRCSDLRKRDYIERTDKALTPSNKFGYRCRITEVGEIYLQLADFMGWDE